MNAKSYNYKNTTRFSTFKLQQSAVKTKVKDHFAKVTVFYPYHWVWNGTSKIRDTTYFMELKMSSRV